MKQFRSRLALSRWPGLFRYDSVSFLCFFFSKMETVKVQLDIRIIGMNEMV